MKRIAATIATTLLAASAAATDIYQGLGEGNSDLMSGVDQDVQVTGVQREVGDTVDLYRGFGSDNDDLSLRFEAEITDHEHPDIYGVAGDNPDL